MIRTLTILLASALPAQTATTQNYGTGCLGGLLSLSLPVIGKPVHASIQNNDALFGYVGVSLQPANIPIGACTLLIAQPAQLIPFTSAGGGTASATLFTLPNNTGLIGIPFYVQATSADTGASSWTQGVKATVGR